MTKKELFDRLNKVRDLEAALRIVDIKIERLESCLQGHAIRYDDVKVQTSPEDHVAEVMGDLEGLLKKRARLQIGLTRAVGDIADLIDSIQDTRLCLLMHYRYTACLTWPEVAQSMHYGERHVYKLHDQAIRWLCENVA